VGHVVRRDLAHLTGDRGACPLEELPDGSMRLIPADRPHHDRPLPLPGEAARDRGPLHPRRRPALRGRVGLRGLRGRLPAPRVALRPADGHGALAAGLPPVPTYPSASARTDDRDRRRQRVPLAQAELLAHPPRRLRRSGRASRSDAIPVGPEESTPSTRDAPSSADARLELA
jgi:hypothetical protein